MHRRGYRFAILFVALVALPWQAIAGLSPELQKALENSKYVYISSTRKSGSLSTPAEIWFLFHNGAVYVGTRPTSWRVRRIKAGRPDAKIAVGTVDGPSFTAAGSLVNDASIQDLMMKTYAKKYPDGWSTHEQNFRDGFKTGDRVLVKYAPKS